MNRYLFTLILTIGWGISNLSAQDATAYEVYTGQGKHTTYKKMLQQAAEADVVFFGEQHNNALAHWLELRVLKDLYAQHPALALGMEMFEADDQLLLDEYQHDVIPEKSFVQEAKCWDNYTTDYKPLVDYALAHQLPVLATNIPRRYANLVYRRGLAALDSLAPTAQQWIAPLPIHVDLSLPSYHDLLAAGPHSGGGGGGAENLAYAQAIKDATMAYFIQQALQAHDNLQVLHMNGAYHTQHHEGIVWFLQQQDPDLHILVIQTVEQDDLGKLETDHENTADFIIALPTDMAKTY